MSYSYYYYQFIKTQGNGWANAIDTNGNSHIEKGEMENFLKSTSADMSYFDEFWQEFDRTTQGTYTDGTGRKRNEWGSLNDNEMEKMQQKFAFYANVESALASVTIPSEMGDVLRDVSALRNLIAEQLSMYVDESKGAEEIQRAVDALEGPCAALLYGETLVKNIVNGEQNHFAGYDLGNDPDLTNILNRYVNSCSGYTPAQIAEDLTNIIQYYFRHAGASEFGEVNLKEELSDYKYTGTGINELQRVRLYNKLKASITPSNVNPPIDNKYKEQFDSALEAFFNKMIESGNRTFTDLYNLMNTPGTDGIDKLKSDFMNSDAMKALTRLIALSDQELLNGVGYSNSSFTGLDSDSNRAALQQRMYGLFQWELGLWDLNGRNFNDTVKAIMNCATYKDIVDAVYSEVAAGNIEINKFADEVAKRVRLNLQEILESTNLSGEEIEKVLYHSYNSAADSSNGYYSKYSDDDRKQMALMYYNFISEWDDDELQNKLEQWTPNGISNLSNNKIFEKLKKLHDFITTNDVNTHTEDDPPMYDCTWTGIDDLEIESGEKITPKIDCEVKDGDSTVNSKIKVDDFDDDVFTKVKFSGGQLTIQAADVDEDTEGTITLNVEVNGKVVETKTITVQILAKEVTPETLPKPSGLSGASTLIDKAYKEGPRHDNFVSDCMANFATHVTSKLAWQEEYAKCGVTEEQWNNALTTLNNYMTAILTCVANFDWDSDDVIDINDKGYVTLSGSYYDVNSGKNVSLNSQNDSISGRRANSSDWISTYDTITHHTPQANSGVRVGCNYDWWGSNHYYCYVEKDIMWNKFLQFLHLD